MTASARTPVRRSDADGNAPGGGATPQPAPAAGRPVAAVGTVATVAAATQRRWWLPLEDLRAEPLLRGCATIEFEGAERPVLGGYVLLARRGRGGMGVIYLAGHTRTGREVAVKVLPWTQAADDAELVERFFREARLAGEIQSSHLVGVLDVDADPATNHYYLVLEHVRGRTAAEWLATAMACGMPGGGVAAALDIVVAATSGLLAAHALGVIHRDVKPSNILIPEDSAGNLMLRRAKLSDLGIARVEHADATIGARNGGLGTPGYTAPEQAMEGRTAMKSSDVYAMGATLYTLLAGRPPFTGTTPIETLVKSIRMPHIPLREVRGNVPEGVSALVDQCLAKDPAARPQDAGALLAGLQRCREAISPEPPRPGAQAEADDDLGQSNAGADGAPERPAAPANASDATQSLATTERFDAQDGTAASPDAVAVASNVAEIGVAAPAPADTCPDPVLAVEPTGLTAAPAPTRAHAPIPAVSPTPAVASTPTPTPAVPATPAVAAPVPTTAAEVPPTPGVPAPAAVVPAAAGPVAADAAPGAATAGGVFIPPDLIDAAVVPGTPPRAAEATGTVPAAAHPCGIVTRVASPRRRGLKLAVAGVVVLGGVAAAANWILGGATIPPPVTRTTSVAKPAAKPVVAARKLRLVSTPAGADVSIEGKVVGVTPWAGPSPPLPFTVSIGDRYHVAWTRKVTEAPQGDLPFDFDAELARGTGKLALRGGPPGTHVSLQRKDPPAKSYDLALDGTGSLAPTPIEAGSYAVRAARDGFESFAGDVEVPCDGAPSVALKMPPTGRVTKGDPKAAGLDLRSLPADVNVKVDGAPAATKLVRGPEARKVAVQIDRPGFLPQSVSVELTMGQDTSPLLAAWTPVPGTLDVSAFPADTTFQVDGIAAVHGVTVAAGARVLRAVRDGYEPVQIRMTVKPGARTAPRAPAWIPSAEGPADVTALLRDCVLWDHARSPSRLAAARVVEDTTPGFRFLRLESFTCGSVTRETAVFEHAVTGLEFSLVPAATFQMGSLPREDGRFRDEARRRVTITRAFLVARTECPQSVYVRWMGAYAPVFAGDDRPVESVSWDEAAAFCRRAGLRLPTEAEWEWACRAGAESRFVTGEGSLSLRGAANLADRTLGALRGGQVPGARREQRVPTDAAYEDALDDGAAGTAPVAARQPNAFGLFDVHGNVTEWCLDVYAAEPRGTTVDPLNVLGGPKHVARGGSWACDADHVRSARRFDCDPSVRASDIGFRPVQSVGAPPRVPAGRTAPLASLDAWTSATSAARRAAAEAVQARNRGFRFLSMENVACGGRTAEIAVFAHDVTGLAFVLVPAGTFSMGSPDGETGRDAGETAHDVTLSSPVFVARTECTQAAWAKVMTPCVAPVAFAFAGAERPADSVTWEDAQAFCARAGLRLPTEADWEHACRGGAVTAFATGGTAASLKGFANLADRTIARLRGKPLPDGLRDWTVPAGFAVDEDLDDGIASTGSAGRAQCNALGLFDVHGNVAEWCEDVFAPYSVAVATPATDALVTTGGTARVVRGGSWRDVSGNARCASRFAADPASRSPATGFRPVKTVVLGD